MKKRISITIDCDLLQKLKTQAEYDCRPLSQYINLILIRAMESETKKQEKPDD